MDGLSDQVRGIHVLLDALFSRQEVVQAQLTAISASLQRLESAGVRTDPSQPSTSTPPISIEQIREAAAQIAAEAQAPLIDHLVGLGSAIADVQADQTRLSSSLLQRIDDLKKGESSTAEKDKGKGPAEEETMAHPSPHTSGPSTLRLNPAIRHMVIDEIIAANANYSREELTQMTDITLATLAEQMQKQLMEQRAMAEAQQKALRDNQEPGNDGFPLLPTIRTERTSDAVRERPVRSPTKVVDRFEPMYGDPGFPKRPPVLPKPPRKKRGSAGVQIREGGGGGPARRSVAMDVLLGYSHADHRRDTQIRVVVPPFRAGSTRIIGWEWVSGEDSFIFERENDGRHEILVTEYILEHMSDEDVQALATLPLKNAEEAYPVTVARDYINTRLARLRS